MTKRRYNDDDDLLDENDVLKDGRTLRVSMTMMDSMSPLQRAIASDHEMRRVRAAISGGDDARTMVVDAFGNPAGYRPGACYLRFPEHTADHAIAMARDYNRQEARAQYIRDLCDAWKGPNISDREVARLHHTGDPVRDAYMDQLADLTTAWAKGSGRR